MGGRIVCTSSYSYLHSAELLPRPSEVHIMPPLQIAGLVRLATHCRHRSVQIQHLYVRLASKQSQSACVVIIDTLVEIGAAATAGEALRRGAIGCRDGSGGHPEHLAPRGQGCAGCFVDDAEVLDVLRESLSPSAVSTAES